MTMAEENNLPKDISNLEDENVTEEEQQDNHPPAPKRAKVVWQETLIALVAAQQKQLSEMTEITRHSKMATGPTPSTSATGEGSAQALANTSFRLSEFNPESSDYAIEEWLDIATKLKAELHIGDVLMIAKAGEALKGSAHRYYCDWRPVHRTWDEFCKDLIVAFPDRETPGARAFTAATLRSRDCESLSDYGIRKLRSINRFHRDLPWNTILSMVEYGLDHGEAQATIRMHQPTGDRELLKILSEFDARRRKQRVVQNQSSRSTDVSSMPRRRENFVKGSCFRCGQSGHHKNNCNVDIDKDTSAKVAVETKDGPPTCSHCKKMGHTESNCWLKHGRPKKAFVVKK
ncbi:uncharacterized protein LOC135266831 [Tribolium castaneum]|uniref:uncharacterized protein LOC135266831 n=1 Tax=Tribolium castaneum TaxID=7070 RepID=UPI0030FE457F